MKDAVAADSSTSTGSHENQLRLLDLFLRLAVVPFTAASIWVMVKNKEAIESYGGSGVQRCNWPQVTSGSAVIEIFYLAHEGDRSVSWSEVCSCFTKFCINTKVSLVFHLMALICFLTLSRISGYRLFSKFEAPSLSSKNDEVENE